jgi:hypothetical protein
VNILLRFFCNRSTSFLAASLASNLLSRCL